MINVIIALTLANSRGVSIIALVVEAKAPATNTRLKINKTKPKHIEASEIAH